MFTAHSDNDIGDWGWIHAWPTAVYTIPLNRVDTPTHSLLQAYCFLDLLNIKHLKTI